MSDKEDELAIPLLLDTPSSSSSVQPNGPLIRTGTVWTAIAHVITGVIGSGVSPDPQFGPARNPSYTAAVKSYLGEKSMWVCGAFVQESYYGYWVAYTITAAIRMSDVAAVSGGGGCGHGDGSGGGGCGARGGGGGD
ncbi:putative amino acid permease 7 [Camellia lanceoleosa]|uniref:Amino acid permease 7 n=1 Tax=Camellia lanceoleosa TaxID=1840588 RepID=A0ACC0H4L8_9ERIC|nr:putative amino acid permease 7 [Camellia lanceoleosa]